MSLSRIALIAHAKLSLSVPPAKKLRPRRRQIFFTVAQPECCPKDANYIVIRCQLQFTITGLRAADEVAGIDSSNLPLLATARPMSLA
jgi:hypothetical protein